MKYSKYFGAKRRGFVKIKSVLAPKGAIHLLNENIRYDKNMKWRKSYKVILEKCTQSFCKLCCFSVL